MSMTPRFRFAPRPTDVADVENLRTAVFNWALSRAMDGDFVIRAEDVDTLPGASGDIQPMLDALAWLGIDWDEGPDVGGDYGPYVQSERRPFYQRAIDQLLAGGHTYYGDDPDQPAASEGNPLHLRMPREGQTILEDAIRGSVVFDNQHIEAPLIAHGDGRPSHHLVAVVDDHDMDVSHVVRGDNWIDDSPIHIQLYRALGWQEPVWVHLPPILYKDGEELAKYDAKGNYLVTDFQAAGYLAPAVFNTLLLLGFSPENNQEILSRWEVRRQFRLERLSASPSVFDWDKLNRINRHTIQKLSDAELAQRLQPFLEDAYGEMPMSSGWLERVTSLVRADLDKLGDAVDVAEWAFVDDFDYSENARRALASEQARPVLARLIAEVAAVVLLDDQTAYSIIQSLYTSFHASHGWETQQVSRAIRAALTGQTDGPPVHAVMGIIGKQRTLVRVANALKKQ